MYFNTDFRVLRQKEKWFTGFKVSPPLHPSMANKSAFYDIFKLTFNVQNELSARRPAHVWSGVCRANQRREAEADTRADWLI